MALYYLNAEKTILHSAQLKLLQLLSSKVSSLGIFDIGSDGGLKGGPLNALTSLKEAVTFNFEANKNQPNQDDWIKSIKDNNTLARQKSIDVPFLADKSRNTRAFFEANKPQCSSCLLPDLENLSDYHDINRFKTKDTYFLKSISIDEISGAFGIAPLIVKIDTQGFDLEVIKGMNASIQAFRPWIITEMNTMKFYKNQATIGTTSLYLEKRGYSLLKIFPCNHHMLTPDFGPNVMSFFDGLWIPEKSLTLPLDHLYRELILHVAFGVCFSPRFMQTAHQVPERDEIARLTNCFVEEYIETKIWPADHVH